MARTALTAKRSARLPGGGQGRGPAQSCEGRGPPSLHPPPWPRYTLRVLLVCLLWGLAHSVRSACGVVGACSLRSLRVRGVGACSLRLLRVRGVGACSLRSLRVRGCGLLARSARLRSGGVCLLAPLACARVGFACSLRSLALGWGFASSLRSHRSHWGCWIHKDLGWLRMFKTKKDSRKSTVLKTWVLKSY